MDATTYVRAATAGGVFAAAALALDFGWNGKMTSPALRYLQGAGVIAGASVLSDVLASKGESTTEYVSAVRTGVLTGSASLIVEVAQGVPFDVALKNAAIEAAAATVIDFGVETAFAAAARA